MVQVMADKFLATNKMNSRELFQNRTVYMQEAFVPSPASVVSNDMIRDFWLGDSLYYGRLDLNQNFVSPKSQKLKTIPSTKNKTIYVLDFVADAFAGLKRVAKNKINDGCLPLENMDGTPEAYIGPFEPERGFADLLQNYNANLKSYYKVYKDSFLAEKGNFKNVLDFNDFINTFFSFMLNLPKNGYPLLPSDLLASQYSSVLNTGLAIDISPLDAGNDTIKEDDFINNPRMNFYRNVASEYGFYIDKNVPWRLVANLGSPLMKEYILQRFPGYTDIQSLFDEYYIPSTSIDLETLKNAMLVFYNRLAAQRRGEVITSFVNGCRITNVIMRPSITREQMEQEYGNDFWLEKYVMFRNNSSSLDYSKASLAKIIKNSIELEKAFDLMRATEYIDYKFRGLTSAPRSVAYENLASSLEDSGLASDEKKAAIQLAAKSENFIAY